MAQRKSQTAIGEYNKLDTTGADGTVRGKYALIVGNGTNANSRSNALTVDWDGRVECGDYSGNLNSIFDIFYPVGSYYETSDANFDPEVAWGGTWVLETEGQVHISAGNNYAVSGALTNSSDGGSASVTLTSSQSGNQALTYVDTTYKLNTTNRKPGTSTAVAYGTSITATANNKTIAAKNATSSHNNMQPYIVVYRWHRTA